MTFSFKSFSSFLFAFIFLSQNLAWAAGVPNPETKQALANFVKEFNSLTPYQKMGSVLYFSQKLPSADQDALNSYIGDPSKVVFPELKFENGIISLSNHSTKIKIHHISGTSFEVNGAEINVGAGKMDNALKRLEKMFHPKATSVIDFIIAPVYANEVIGIAAGIVGIVAGLLIALAGAIASIPLIPLGFLFVLASVAVLVESSNRHDVAKVCNSFNSNLADLSVSPEASLLANTKDEISKAKRSVFSHSYCKTSNKSKLALCVTVKKCLTDLESSLDKIAVDDSARTSHRKDSSSPSKNSATPTKSTIKQ